MTLIPRRKTRLFRHCLLCGSLVALTGFGAAVASQKRVIATSEDPSDTGRPVQSTRQQQLKARIERDGRTAAALLTKTVCGETALSAWSAVYLRRLGIPHDDACAARAIRNGVADTDLLLKALCWRHLAVMKSEPLPEWSAVASPDPAVSALAAIAYAVRGAVPAALQNALAVPAGVPTGASAKAAVEKRANHLGALGIPFDDAPVSLAVAFAEARAAESPLGKGAGKRFAALDLRTALLMALFGKNRHLSGLRMTGPSSAGPGTLSAYLDDRLTTRSLETLHAMALTGETSLRRASLRALAVVASAPTAGDLAAAAAALKAADLAIRVEGARTFLMLVRRIR